MHVLYVEDNSAEAKVLEMMLQDEGHFCHTTDLGQQAVVLAKRNDYDLIILDIMLPDIDGYEVIQRLRDSEIRTPILVQTGLVDRETRTDDTGLGVEDFLIKPFSKEELKDRMESVLSKPAQLAPPASDSLAERPKDTRENQVERRQHKRFSTVKAAHIVQGEHQIACVVLNQSYGGAAIRLPNANLQCPDSFELQFNSGPSHTCQIVWRDGDKVGVKFT